MIISRNLDYFEMLLNKQRNRNGILKIDNLDLEKIKNAFEKAHDIRKFEISLYWQRSGYILGFISVLAAAIAYCFSAYVTDNTTDGSKFILLMTIVCLAIVGISLCRFWTRIIKASKYWQDNWEYNIDMLEPYVSGNLHKIHFYRTDRDYNRFSIHDIVLSISHRVGIILYIMIAFIFAVIFNEFHPFLQSLLSIPSIPSTITEKNGVIYLAVAPVFILYLLVDLFVVISLRKKDKLREKSRVITHDNLKVTIDKISCSKG